MLPDVWSPPESQFFADDRMVFFKALICHQLPLFIGKMCAHAQYAHHTPIYCLVAHLLKAYNSLQENHVKTAQLTRTATNSITHLPNEAI